MIAVPEVIKLVIEAGNDGVIWGRVSYNDNLITEFAENPNELQAKIKQLLMKYHGLNPDMVKFDIEYDLAAFFELFSFLKITKVAELAGINGSLMRQYATGKKFPSKKQKDKIEMTIKDLSTRLSSINFFQEA